MKTWITVLIVCAFGIASASGAPATTQANARTLGGIRHISITWQAGPVNVDRILQLVNLRMAESAPKILGLSTESNLNQWFSMETTLGDHAIQVNLFVNLAKEGSAKPAAREFLDDLVNSLQGSIRADFDQTLQKQTDPVDEEEMRAKNDLANAEKESNELRAKIRQLAGRADISAKTINDTMTRLEDESMRLELDILAKTARRDAMAKEIAEQSEKVQQKMGKDAIAAELQKVVEAREAQVERIKQMIGTGQATQGALDETIGHAAEARAKLLERQRDAALEAGGETVPALNKDLSTLTIDLRELKARLEFVKSRLPGMRDATDLLDQWDRVGQQEARAQKNLDSAHSEMQALSRKFSGLSAPQFIVTESDNQAKGYEEAADKAGSLFNQQMTPVK